MPLDLMCCSSRISPVPNSAAIALLAGRCRIGSSIYISSFASAPTACHTVAGSSLLGALAHFGLDGLDATEKKEIQVAIGTGTWRGQYIPEQILDYCQTDVDALVRLLPVMWPAIDLPRALLRGRYMAAASAMEHAGVPIDMATLTRLREGWTGIQDRLIAAIDRDYKVYDGRSFRSDRFANYLVRHQIPWPRLDSGSLDLSDNTFRSMAKGYPSISPLRELRSSLSDMRLNDLTVGRDARNRAMLSPFRARTGRNQPSEFEIHLRPVDLDSWTDQTTTRPRHRVHRLVAARICDCRISQRRPQYDCSLRSPATATWRSGNRPV